jgi:MSHA pilin protein MshA
MNKSIKTAQSGFTLIELIVVIVILGILAATALPKFANLGGDARLSSLNAVKGSLGATAAMAHGKYLVNTGARLTQLTIEGSTVTFPTADPFTGYPQANAGLAGAAGITAADYTIIGPNQGAKDTSPATGPDEIAIIPNSVASTPAGLTCFVKYKEAAANAQPTISLGTTKASDCE